MTYYIRNSRREAEFELFQKVSWLPWRDRVQDALGVQQGDKPMYLPGSGLSGFGGYPSYEIVTVGGQTDIIEHRRQESIFYMVDDEEIFRQLNVAPNGSGQRSVDSSR